MKAVFKKNRADESRRIAFHEVGGARPIHLYPAREEDPSSLLGECEVMISKVLRSEENSIKCAFVRRPSEFTVRVVFDGFEISGSECSTSARYWIMKPDEKWASAEEAVCYYRAIRRCWDGTVYPGLLLGDLVTADNVNPPHDQQLTPGFGWIEKYVRDGVQRWRLAGVDSFTELQMNERAPA